jgi:hypothetical protein
MPINIPEHKRFIQHTLLLFLAVTLILVAISGRRVTKDQDVYQEVGRFIVRPYKFGIYLTERDSGIFYNISPYNDGILTPEANEYSKEYLEITANRFLSNRKNALLTYFGLNFPKATFNRYTYTAPAIDDSTIVSSVENELKVGIGQRTLSYNEEDFILDQDANIITPTTQEQMGDVSKILGKKVRESTSSQLLMDIKDKEFIVIANEKNTGALKISLSEPNYVTAYLDKENNLIDIRTADSLSQIKIEVVDSIRTVFND